MRRLHPTRLRCRQKSAQRESARSDCNSNSDYSSSCVASSGGGDDDDDGSHASEPVEESGGRTLKVGDEAHHDFLGIVKVVQFFSEGCDECFKNKIEVELPTKARVRSKPTTRWVFADYLAPVPSKSKSKVLELKSVGATNIEEEEDFDLDGFLEDHRGGTSGLGKDKPRAPQAASIQRKRKVAKLHAARKHGRRPKLGQRKTKEPKVSPAQRIAEFPDHSLRISNERLFCDCCVIELSMRKGTVRTHIKGKHHETR